MAKADNWRDAELTVREANDEDAGTQTTHHSTLFAAVWRDDDGTVQTAVTDPTLGADLAALTKETKADKASVEVAKPTP